MHPGGARNLCMAVLDTAYQDKGIRDPKRDDGKDLVTSFMEEDWCLELCIGLGIDHKNYLMRLKDTIENGRSVKRPEHIASASEYDPYDGGLFDDF